MLLVAAQLLPVRLEPEPPEKDHIRNSRQYVHLPIQNWCFTAVALALDGPQKAFLRAFRATWAFFNVIVARLKQNTTREWRQRCVESQYRVLFSKTSFVSSTIAFPSFAIHRPHKSYWSASQNNDNLQSWSSTSPFVSFYQYHTTHHVLYQQYQYHQLQTNYSGSGVHINFHLVYQRDDQGSRSLLVLFWWRQSEASSSIWRRPLRTRRYRTF